MQPLTSEERIQKAEQAANMALLCVILCLMVNCGGCFTVFAALPMSLWVLHMARTAMEGDDVPDLAMAYAAPARNLSIVTALFSSLVLLFIVTYIGLYVVMFAFMFGATLLGNI